MFTGRTLEGNSIEEMLDPSFRKITFHDESAVTFFARTLRTAWTYLPHLSATGELESVQEYFGISSTIDPSEVTSALPQNPDLETIDTPWRKQIGVMWNCVFSDVMSFLETVSGTVGHFHDPNQDFVPIRYEDLQDGMVELSWEIGVLLIDTYRAPGVTIKIIMQSAMDAETWVEKDRFDGTNPYEIWYVKPGAKVRIALEGESVVEGAEGVAVVLSRALLCHEGERHSAAAAVAELYSGIPDNSASGEADAEEAGDRIQPVPDAAGDVVEDSAEGPQRDDN